MIRKIRVRAYKTQAGVARREHTRRRPLSRRTKKVLTVVVSVSVAGTAVASVQIFRGEGRIPKPPKKGVLSEKEVKVELDATLKNISVTFSTKGYSVQVLQPRLDHNCAANSYGDEVTSFFKGHPCNSVERGLVELKDKRRHTILVAVAFVTMPDGPSAVAYKCGVDGKDTGNITELSKLMYQYADKKYDSAKYWSGYLSETTVWNTQVLALPEGGLAEEVLNSIGSAGSPGPPSDC